ncbi:serine-rich adhesin for platelets-like [Athalia rosae]|uniref:serine-rich adhesin for platelets-like n=1 Tax=Athalia rosae TaxID=37344 RepID=UPI0020336BCC|nr:serine-rich adhesin for platelets-like [Athalia rosae]
MIERCLLATALLATLAAVTVSKETYASDVVVPTECPETDPLDTTIHIAHEWDCTRFYTCFNGEKVLTTCADRDPNGNRLHFDPVLQVCVWPENSTCSNKDPSPEVTTEGSAVTGTSKPTGNGDTTVVTTAPSGDDEQNNNNEESTTSAAPGSSDDSENTKPTIPTECPAEDGDDAVHIAHESDCRLFYQCDSGEKVLKECINGLLFNPVLQVCDWPENVDCASNGGGSEEGTKSPVTPNDDVKTSTESVQTTTTRKPNNSEESTTSAAPGSSDDSENTKPTIPTECPAENGVDAVHIAHESDCRLFYQCDSGEKVLKECINGLLFNPVLQVCDWPENVDCASNGGGSEEGTKSPVTPNDDVKTSTESVQTTTTRKPNNSEESTTSAAPGSSDDSENTKPTIPTECPAENGVDAVHIAHESDCRLFYQCDSGEKVLKECINGLLFNPVLQVCDWPENVDCASNGGGSEEGTKSPVTPNDDVKTSTESVQTTTTRKPNNSEESTTSAAPGSSDDSENTKPTIPTECPAENGVDAVHIAHESDCRLFYQCDSGEKVLKECINGLLFNPVLQVCDWPENVDCASNGGGSEEGTKSPVTPNDDVKTSTESVQTTTTRKPNNSEESTTSAAPGSSDDSENTKPTIPTECPAENGVDAVHIAHESDCRLFYQCDSGEKVLKECINGLLFNPVLQVCDWPENVDCASNGGGSEEGTKSPVTPNDDVKTSTESVQSTTTRKPNNSEESTTSAESNPSTTEKNENAESTTSAESNPSTTENNENAESTTSAESNPSTTEKNENAEPTTSAAPGSSDDSENTKPTIPTECPAENEGDAVHIAHESDCGLFYQCDWGHKVLKECPSGLHFNPVLQVCDWPENVGCSSNGGNSGEGTKPPVTSNDDAETSTESVQSTTSKPNDSEESTTSAAPGSSDDSENTKPTIPTECPAENEGDAVHIAHESDCGLFYQCDWGHKVLKECPSGLHFNPVLQVCDWPENVGCSSNGGSSGEGTKPPVTSNDDAETSTESVQSTTSKPNDSEESTTSAESNPSTTENNENAESTTSAESNPPTTENNENAESTTSAESNPSTTGNTENAESTTTAAPGLPDDSENTKPTVPTECPAENGDDAVHIAHESDCGLFYQCDRGHKVLNKCPSGLHFNPVLQVCDWPENVDCASNGGSNPNEPEKPDEVETTVSTDSTTSAKPEEVETTVSTDSTTSEKPDEVITTVSTDSTTSEKPDEVITTVSTDSTTSEKPDEVETTVSTDSTTSEKPDEVITTVSTDSTTSEKPDEVVTTVSTDSTTSEESDENGTTVSAGSTASEESGESSTTTAPNETSDPNEFEWSTPAGITDTNNTVCPLAFIPHECKCNLFYKCDEQGRWIRQSCASGLQFNDRTQVCDWPHNVGCVDGADQTTSPSTEAPASVPTVKPTSAPVSSTTKVTTTTEVTTAKQTTTPAYGTECSGTCPSVDPLDYTVLLAHKDCTKFCMCSNGVQFVRNCPGLLYFNNELKTCDWPEASGCVQAAYNVNSIKEFGVSSQTSFLEVNDKIAYGVNTHFCEFTMIGSHLFATVLVAILAAVSSNAEVVVPTECPRIDPLNTTIHIAHEWDCTRFYTCSNGRKILTTCADRDLKGGRLYFDPVLQVCVWPEDSTCGKNGTITSVSTEGSTSRSSSESGNTNSTVNSTTESSSESGNTNSTGSSTTESSSASGNTNSTESSTTESSSASGNTNSTESSTTESSSASGNTNSTESSTTESSSASENTNSTESSTIESSSASGNTNSTESSTMESSSESGNTNSTVNSTTESSSESGNTNSTESSTTESNSASGNTNSTESSTTESSSESGNTNSTESSTTESSSESGNTTSTESSTTESSSASGNTNSTGSSTTESSSESGNTTSTESSTTESSSESGNTNSTVNSTTESSSESGNTNSTESSTTESSSESGNTNSTESSTTESSSESGNTNSTESSTTESSSESGNTTSTESSTTESSSESGNTNSTVNSTTESSSESGNTNSTESSTTESNSASGNTNSTESSTTESSSESGNTNSTVNSTTESSSESGNTNSTESSTTESSSESGNTNSTESSTTESSSESGNTNSTESSTTESSSESGNTNSTESSTTESSSGPGITETTVPSQCPAENEGYAVHIAHESECGLFYQCDWGKKVLKECPGGLHFNSILQVCDWPESAGCSLNGSVDANRTNSTDSEISTTKITSTTAKSDNLTVSTTSSVVGPCERSGACPSVDPLKSAVLLAHEDCTKFCICSNGTPYLFECPGSLYFNDELKVCDWPETSGCVQTT